jgi:hypothetical protein
MGIMSGLTENTYLICNVMVGVNKRYNHNQLCPILYFTAKKAADHLDQGYS